MSRFIYSHSLASDGRPDVAEVLVGKSTRIYAGDVLVLDIGSTWTGTTTSQRPVVRPLFSGDTVTTSNGIFGVALFDFATDSSGYPTSVTSLVTVDAKSQVRYALNSIGDGLPADPTSGYTRIYVATFAPINVFAALTAANDIASFYLNGRAVGITCSAASAPSTYLIDDDAAAANAPLTVVGVDTQHPQFQSANGGGRVFVIGRPTFYQYNTGTFHST